MVTVNFLLFFQGHLGPSYTQKRRCREKQPRGDALVGMVQKSPRGEGNTSPEIRLPRPGGSLRCSGGPACAGRTAARPPRSPPAAGTGAGRRSRRCRSVDGGEAAQPSQQAGRMGSVLRPWVGRVGAKGPKGHVQMLSLPQAWAPPRWALPSGSGPRPPLFSPPEEAT